MNIPCELVIKRIFIELQRVEYGICQHDGKINISESKILITQFYEAEIRYRFYCEFPLKKRVFGCRSFDPMSLTRNIIGQKMEPWETVSLIPSGLEN